MFADSTNTALCRWSLFFFFVCFFIPLCRYHLMAVLRSICTTLLTPADEATTSRKQLDPLPSQLSHKKEKRKKKKIHNAETRACERSGASSEERSVQNIVGARSGFLSKGWSDRSVSLRFRSDTAHTTSLGHAQIHPECTCAFNN